LAIAFHLVRLFGGKMWVESAESEGSTFFFTIPFVTGVKVEKNVTTQSKLSNTDKKIILIAEDEEDNYKFLLAILDKINVDTIWAKNGLEAVEIIKSKNPIDLILMDIKMAEMNGYEATQQIKKIVPNIPIIAQTAYALAGAREKSLEAGCDNYIDKPINAEKLLSMINQYI